MELFDLSHVECCSRLADEGVIRRPLHYNFCVGPGASSNLSATGRNLALLNALAEPGSSWGINHDSMKDFSMLACAIGMGANAVRVGFEDSFYYAPGQRAHTNAELVERLVQLIRLMGCEPVLRRRRARCWRLALTGKNNAVSGAYSLTVRGGSAVVCTAVDKPA